MKGSVTFLIALCLCSGMYLLTGINRPIDPYDEGIILTGSLRVAQGSLPYRDFWTVYAPGQFFVVGSIFALFGKSLLLFRLYDFLIKLTIVGLLSACSLKVHSKLAASLTAILATLWLERMGLTGYTIFPALLFSLITLLFLENKKWLLASVSLFLVGFFRHDFAVYLSIILAFHVIYTKNILKTLFGAAVLVGGASTVIILLIPTQNLYEQLVLFPLFVFPKQMQLPFSQLFGENLYSALVAAFPFFTLLATARNSLQKRFSLQSMLWFTATALLLQVRVRSDFPHLLPSFLVILPLFSVFYSSTFGKKDPSSLFSNALCSLLFVVLVGLPLQSKIQSVTKLSTKTQRAISAKVALEYTALESLLPRCNNSLFILPPERSLKVRADVASYYIWDIQPPTVYYEPHPGMIDQSPYLERIIEEIKKNQVHCILWSNPYAESLESLHTEKNTLERFIELQHGEILFQGKYLKLEKIS